LRSRWLGFLWDVAAIFRLKAVTADLDGLSSKLSEQILGLLCIPDKLAIFDVGIFLADQPLDRRPRAAGTLPANSLKMAGVTDILRAEGFKIASVADFHMIVISLPAATRFSASTARWFCRFAIWTFSTGCHLGLLSSFF
jgi:hypothetical protein